MQDNWDVATGLTGTGWVDSLFLLTAAMQSKSVRYSYCSHHVWNILESSEINFFKFRIIFGILNFDHHPHHRMRGGVYSHSFRMSRHLKIWHCTDFLGAFPDLPQVIGIVQYPVSSPHQDGWSLLGDYGSNDTVESNCREFSCNKSKQIDIPHCCLRY